MKMSLLLVSALFLLILPVLAQQKDSVYTFPQLMPEFRGGVKGMSDFIRINKHYPEAEKISRKEGRIWITAVLDTNGNVTDVKLLRGQSLGFDSEALFLVKSMPAWLPGYTDNGPVRTRINIPIDFSLSDTIVLRKADTTDIKRVVRIAPSFRGNLQDFLAKNLNYPEKERDKGVSGKVYVQFILNEVGWVSDARVVKSSGNAALDKEAVRVVSIMPPWNPGINNGTPVKVYFSLPIVFTVE